MQIVKYLKHAVSDLREIVKPGHWKKLRGIVMVTAIVIGITAVVGGAYEMAYWQKIYPGVRVAGVSLGNLSVEQARRALQVLRQAQDKPAIELVWGTSKWKFDLEELGVKYDWVKTASSAWNLGRSGSKTDDLKFKIGGWIREVELEPVIEVGEEKLNSTIASISAVIDIPAREPEVALNGAEVKVTPGENGQRVDTRELGLLIKQAAIKMTKEEIQIPVKQLKPRLGDSDIQSLRERGQRLVGKRVILSLEGQRWEVGAEQILTWLNTTGGVGWKREKIETWVKELSGSVNRPAQNAAFRYVGEGKVEEFKPAIEGMAVKQEELVEKLMANLGSLEGANNEMALEIPVRRTSPTVKTADVNSLGIKELIGRGESDFSGSAEGRAFNLTKAAGMMNGVLVAPGEVFSFNKHVGEISAEVGYKQAYIIKNGRTVLGDGGGVCQVSTTLFRAILNTGLPIEERWAHAYRVRYYEKGSQPGFDATIFTPSVDLKFKNDTSAYILVQSRVEETKLMFDLYGTSDGRKVEISKARVWDVTAPPPPQYVDDPNLPTGVVKQVDWAAWGAKAAFDWKVTRGSEVLQERTFFSNFRPWQAVYLRGTRS